MAYGIPKSFGVSRPAGISKAVKLDMVRITKSRSVIHKLLDFFFIMVLL